ncbi:MAG: family 10 glycosylhydrolase [Candidatus Saccharimonadaceae bacterium]
MKRRNFIKNIGAAGLGLMATKSYGMSFAQGIMTDPHNFKKWIWSTLRHDESPEVWKPRFETMKAHGIHGILFQVYSGHKALYPSATLPNEHDLLNPLIKIGKENGVEVHAWMWTMPNNNPFYIENHSNWYIVNRLGESAHNHPAYVDYYKFMCPNNPEVQEFLTKNVRELSAINDLSGVHLDYIRMPDVILAEALQPKYNIVQDKEYPQYDYCYCDICRKKFKDQTGLDPLKDIAEPAENQVWNQFRYDSVTHLVNNLLSPEIKKAGKMSSAAVFPNWQSVRQQWSHWNLDAYFPMLYHNFYNKDINWVGERLEQEIAELKNPAPVYAGLYIPSLTPAELTQAIAIVKQTPAKGYSLFSFGDIKDGHWGVV